MALPPDMSAEELVLKLAEAPFTSEVVPFPRKGMGNIRVRVLEFAEQQAARYEAMRSVGERFRDLKDVVEHLGVPDVTGGETSAAIVARVCYAATPVGEQDDVPRYKRIFKSAQQVADCVRTDEIAALYAAWVDIQNRYAGSERSISSEAEETAWLKRLQEGLECLPLLPPSSQMRGELLCIAAARLAEVTRCLNLPSEELRERLASLSTRWASDTTCSIGQPADSGRSRTERVESIRRMIDTTE